MASIVNNMAAAASNVSFASPLANAKHAQIFTSTQIGGVLSQLSELNGWVVAATLLLVLVAYDQCEQVFYLNNPRIALTSE